MPQRGNPTSVCRRSASDLSPVTNGDLRVLDFTPLVATCGR